MTVARECEVSEKMSDHKKWAILLKHKNPQ